MTHTSFLRLGDLAASRGERRAEAVRMAQATGTFTVASWDESTYQDLGDGAKLTRATITFGMEGDIAGKGTWDALMCYRPDGTAVFTGIQRIQGNMAGVDGSFIVLADGEYAGGEARSRWQVISDTGTGGLAGLTGTGESVATATPPGSFTFDYELS